MHDDPQSLLAVAQDPPSPGEDDSTQAVTHLAVAKTQHWERGVLVAVVVAAALYLLMVVVNGSDRFITSVRSISPLTLGLGLLLVLGGYAIRFCRWQWYLHRMGFRVPLRPSAQIFLASFALTASPGKAGESIKALWLKWRFGVPIIPTLAGLFCERFTDVLAVVLLICIGLWDAPRLGLTLVLGVGVVQVGLLGMLQSPEWLKRHLLTPLERWPRLTPTASRVERMIDHASGLLRWDVLVVSIVLAMLAWGTEGLVLYLISTQLGAPLNPLQAILVHAGSSLIGALSLLPGGIGSTEIALIALLGAYGVAQPAAVTVTVLIRLVTLWFAVLLGIVSMVSLGRRPAAGIR